MTVLIILIGIAAVLAVIILLSWLSSANDPSRYCDGCLKTFAADQVNPCSGDWWLCHNCLDTYMKSDTGIIITPNEALNASSPTDRTP